VLRKQALGEVQPFLHLRNPIINVFHTINPFLNQPDLLAEYQQFLTFRPAGDLLFRDPDDSPNDRKKQDQTCRHSSDGDQKIRGHLWLLPGQRILPTLARQEPFREIQAFLNF
jgi:hypothetical protein